VAPAVGRQQRGNPTVVVQPYGDVEVIMHSHAQARAESIQNRIADQITKFAGSRFTRTRE
jgi:hypothetical protein